MVDYTLDEGQDVTISENTTVENFYYKGGKITVLSGCSFMLTGDFIFCPDNIDDTVGKIFGAILARISLETGYNGAFTGFRLYDLPPDITPLYFPCIIVDREPESEISAELFGNEWIERVFVTIDLAFKSNKYLDVESLRINKKALAEHYLWYMRQIVDDMVYQSDYINIGEVKVEASVQEPQEINQTLYGFALDMSVEFKKKDAV